MASGHNVLFVVWSIARNEPPLFVKQRLTTRPGIQSKRVIISVNTVVKTNPCLFRIRVIEKNNIRSDVVWAQIIQLFWVVARVMVICFECDDDRLYARTCFDLR